MLGDVGISIQQLRTFAAVVELGTFSRAAERLFLTQPAISMQVRRLETLLNAPLLSREGRQVVPTEIGLTVYRYARDVLDVLNALHRDVDAMTVLRLNHISIGATHAYGTYVLPSLLAAFQRAHPAVRLTLVQGNSADLLPQVRHGQLDIVIARSATELTDESAEELGLDESLLVESSTTPVSHAGKLTLEELARAPFVRRPAGRSQLAGWLDRRLAEVGLRPENPIMTVSSWEGVKAAVRAGVGLALAYHAVVGPELQSGEMRTVTVEDCRDIHHVYLLVSAYRQQRRQTVDFQDLLRLLRQGLPSAIAPATRLRGTSA